MKLRPLIKGQSIRIDNHSPGKPMIWDWPNGSKPDDVHLDKTMKEKVNGKYVKTRITLNNDMIVNVPKKCEREDKEWMKSYDRMMKEIQMTLETNQESRDQLVSDINDAIKEIGPNKPKRAVRKAIKRIAHHFNLPEAMFINFKELSKGTVAFFYDDVISQKYYVGFGSDYAFYLGEGDGRAFTRHCMVNDKYNT